MKPHTVITGASRGIGACFAQRLAHTGHPLILAARSAAELDALASQLRGQNALDVRCVPCDLSTPAGVATLSAFCEPLRIGGLINNAGFGMGGAFSEQSASDIDQMLALNIQSLTQLTHTFVPKLKQEQGFLINVASHAAFQPVPFMSAYAASKAYVLHFTEALHCELLPFGVKVQALCPAATRTSFFDVAQIDIKKTKFKMGSVEAVVDASLKGLRKNKSFVIPGFKNSLMTFSGRFAPRSVVARLGQSLMGH